MALIQRVTFIAIALVASTALGEATLEGVSLGTYAAGPKVTANDLNGRVVLFEYWGVNCGPCLASISHVTKLQEKYPRNYFVVVANHRQGGGAANAGKVWQDKAGSNIVSVIDGGSLRGANVRGIPRAFLFDHNGRLIFDGHPSKVDKHVAQAVAASPGFLVAGMDYKVFAREAAVIGRMRGNLSATLKRLRAAAEDEQARGHDEAKHLMERVTEWATGEFESLNADPKADAFKTSVDLKKMIVLLRGDALGEPFVELDQKLDEDPTFRSEVAASRMLTQVKDYASKQGLPSSDDTPRVRAAKSTVARSLDTVVNRYPDTRAAENVAQVKKDLGL